MTSFAPGKKKWIKCDKSKFYHKAKVSIKQ